MVATPPLIEAAELARLLAGDPRLSVEETTLDTPPPLLDVRWELATGPQPEAYERAHIPGAVFVDLDRDLAAPPGARGRHPLPSAPDFARAMRAAGVWRDRTVVVYDAATGMAAARAWWLLRYFGHRSVRVLDGGLAEWTAAGGELQAGASQPAPGDFDARPGAMPVLDADGAAALARAGALLDARAPERFRGEVEPLDPVAGHIPGARNWPMTATLSPGSARLRDPQALRAELAALGVPAGGSPVGRPPVGRPPLGGSPVGGPTRGGPPVGAYCGSGVSAAHLVLALEVAGVPAALYAGSWSEWSRDPARPVATGG